VEILLLFAKDCSGKPDLKGNAQIKTNKRKMNNAGLKIGLQK